jgi:tetratricopeptide (TPR) repeat protein
MMAFPLVPALVLLLVARPEQLVREATTLNKAGRVSAAITKLEEAYRLAPDDPVVVYNLGALHDAAGHIDEALKAYSLYLALAPNADDSKTVEARVASLRAAKIKVPAEARELVLTAQSKLREADVKGAEEALKKAEALAPDWPVVSKNLALLYDDGGATEAARDYWRKYLPFAPPAEAAQVRGKVLELESTLTARRQAQEEQQKKLEADREEERRKQAATVADQARKQDEQTRRREAEDRQANWIAYAATAAGITDRAAIESVKGLYARERVWVDGDPAKTEYAFVKGDHAITENEFARSYREATGSSEIDNVDRPRHIAAHIIHPLVVVLGATVMIAALSDASDARDRAENYGETYKEDDHIFEHLLLPTFAGTVALMSLVWWPMVGENDANWEHSIPQYQAVALAQKHNEGVLHRAIEMVKRGATAPLASRRLPAQKPIWSFAPVVTQQRFGLAFGLRF